MITIILPSATECDRVAVGPRSLKDPEINTDWRWTSYFQYFQEQVKQGNCHLGGKWSTITVSNSGIHKPLMLHTASIWNVYSSFTFSNIVESYQ